MAHSRLHPQPRFLRPPEPLRRAACLAPRPPRRDLLPQRDHLFRRSFEEGGGLEFLQSPHRRRLPPPRPLGVADLALHAIQTAPPEERHGVPEVTPLRALVIDDSAYNRVTISRMLA